MGSHVMKGHAQPSFPLLVKIIYMYRKLHIHAYLIHKFMNKIILFNINENKPPPSFFFQFCLLKVILVW